VSAADACEFQLSDVLPYARDAASVCVRDDFTRCFARNRSRPWNWNVYLRVVWSLGVAFRYGVVLPLRVLVFLTGWFAFAVAFALVTRFVKDEQRRAQLERRLISFVCGVCVASWTGVVKYHGVIPRRRSHQIYVANHTSMIDMIILQQAHSYAVVGQQHKGWVGFLQGTVLRCLGCIWFQRGEQRDRRRAAARISQHIRADGNNRLLIFPEGTCVNNHHVVMFKRGVFDLPDVEICPIAIKYNDVFADCFWSSRDRSFQGHLFDLARVQAMIAKRAGAINTSWNGYLKYFRPSARFVEQRRAEFARVLKSRRAALPHGGSDDAEAKQNSPLTAAVAAAAAAAKSTSDENAPLDNTSTTCSDTGTGTDGMGSNTTAG
ncbi:MAG: hypothetical protein MHM6MM_002723, partial [Cercozoa sp. M6MM]